MPGETIDAMCERAKATHWGDRGSTPVIFATCVDGRRDHIPRALGALPFDGRSEIVNDARVQMFSEVIDRLPN